MKELTLTGAVKDGKVTSEKAQGSAVKRFECPACGRERRNGVRAGSLLLLRCAFCGFRWTEVVTRKQTLTPLVFPWRQGR